MLALLFVFIGFLSHPQDSTSHEQSAASTQDTIPVIKSLYDSAGRFVEINRIFIVGNTRTREQIILRELTLKSGDVVYNLDLAGILDLDRKKLVNTRLFNKVEMRPLEVDGRRIDLLIDVNERWYTFPAPVFELADRNFNDWWQNYDHDLKRVNYGLRLYQYNMRGRNETLRFLAQFGFQRRFELLYRFPYIDKKQKHGLTLELGYLDLKNAAFRTNDHRYEFIRAENTIRTDRTAALTYSYRRSFYKTHMLKVEYRNASINDTLKILNPNYLKTDAAHGLEYTYITYQFNADHRDFFAYPLKGFLLQSLITKSGLAASEDVNKLEANFIYAQYLDLGHNFYFSNYTSLYGSTPKNLPYVNYGALGLRKQFARGYELYVIEGPNYFINKTTFKKRLFSEVYHWGDMRIEQFRHIPVALYFKIYADFGYVENYPAYRNTEGIPNNTRLADTWLSSVGFGFDAVTFYDVVLRFEYTFNAQNERGFFFHVRKEF